MDLMIRHARPGDAAGIADIHVRTWQSAYRELLPDDALDAMTPEQRRPMWERLLAALPVGHGVLVAEIDGTVVGFCSFGPRGEAATSDELELFTIYVNPAAQRAGVGTALLHEAEAAMRNAGARTASLWVLDGNEQAQRFYQKHGWSLDTRQQEDTLFGVAVRELGYTKDLRSGRPPANSISPS